MTSLGIYFFPIAMTPYKAAVTSTAPQPINVDNSLHNKNGSNAKLPREILMVSPILL